MKPIRAKILENNHGDTLFTVKEIKKIFFSTEFHFHPECQLVYILKGEGKRIIGDNIEDFEKDELIFLGSNLPHTWHNNPATITRNEEFSAHSVGLYFHPQSLCKHLSAFGDIKKLELFLNDAKRGVKYFGDTKVQIRELLMKMLNQKGLELTISLLKCIDIMCNTQEFGLLAGNGYINNYEYKDNERIDRVFKYIFDNFKQEISLTTIAGIAKMNIQAFCRYFKIRTQKSFTAFVNEIRIGHACKLMAESEESIIQIAYECGFNSISNFNRFFKQIKGVTPREYRKTSVL